MIFVDAKKGRTTNFSSSSFAAAVGSGIRYPGSVTLVPVQHPLTEAFLHWSAEKNGVLCLCVEEILHIYIYHTGQARIYKKSSKLLMAKTWHSTFFAGMWTREGGVPAAAADRAGGRVAAAAAAHGPRQQEAEEEEVFRRHERRRWRRWRGGGRGGGVGGEEEWVKVTLGHCQVRAALFV